jgi:hypothetical protein
MGNGKTFGGENVEKVKGVNDMCLDVSTLCSERAKPDWLVMMWVPEPVF